MKLEDPISPISPSRTLSSASTLTTSTPSQTPRHHNHPANQAVETTITTTTTHTRPTPHGVETETITRTVTTIAESLPVVHSPSPQPRTARGGIRPRSPQQLVSTGQFERIYLPPRPQSLPVIHADTLYVITRGQKAGIFRSWATVLLHTDSVPNAIYEKRQGWKDAYALYKLAYDEGTVEVTTGQYVEREILIQIDADHEDEGQREYYKPQPQELQCLAGKYKCYTIFRGEEVGVFGNWHQTAIRTERVKDAKYKGFPTWKEAISAYTIAYNKNRVEVVPIPGGRFDNPILSESSPSVEPEEIDEELLHRMEHSYI